MLEKETSAFHQIFVIKLLIIRFEPSSGFPTRTLQNWEFLKIKLEELSHISTTLIAFTSLQNLCHFKVLSNSKSMPQKSNHDFKKRYPYVSVGRRYTRTHAY